MHGVLSFQTNHPRGAGVNIRMVCFASKAIPPPREAVLINCMVCVAENKTVCTKGAEVANLHGVFWLLEENCSPQRGRGEQLHGVFCFQKSQP